MELLRQLTICLKVFVVVGTATVNCKAKSRSQIWLRDVNSPTPQPTKKRLGSKTQFEAFLDETKQRENISPHFRHIGGGIIPISAILEGVGVSDFTHQKEGIQPLLQRFGIDVFRVLLPVE